MKNKNVLITRASGFVVSYLSKCLLDNGANVYGLIRRRSDGSTPKNLVNREINGQLRFIEGELTDFSSLGFALNEAAPDIIFHLATQSYTQRSFTYSMETIGNNTIGTANLFGAIKLKDIYPTVISAGLSEEYGLVFLLEELFERAQKKYGVIFSGPESIPELLISERSPLRPLSPNVVSKVHSENLMRNYYYSYGLKTIISRLNCGVI